LSTVQAAKTEHMGDLNPEFVKNEPGIEHVRWYHSSAPSSGPSGAQHLCEDLWHDNVPGILTLLPRMRPMSPWRYTLTGHLPLFAAHARPDFLLQWWICRPRRSTSLFVTTTACTSSWNTGTLTYQVQHASELFLGRQHRL
jgi:hypothetical protein